jgi:hypothetical protein
MDWPAKNSALQLFVSFFPMKLEKQAFPLFLATQLCVGFLIGLPNYFNENFTYELPRNYLSLNIRYCYILPPIFTGKAFLILPKVLYKNIIFHNLKRIAAPWILWIRPV